MNLELDGKVVLVTGGSKGIGLACARAFAREGARIAIVSRSQENLDAARQELAADGISVATFAVDLTDGPLTESMVATVEDQVGPIASLINSAGAAGRTIPQDLTPETWRLAMDAKFFTYINVMSAVLPRMAARKAGTIVNIVGVGGKHASPTHLAGGAANAALMLASAGLANAWGHARIRVNVINPGSILTGRVQAALSAESRLTGKSREEVRTLTEGRIPLGRYGDPEEIADAALYLASARSSYVTGAALTMDGGLTSMIF